ncbi:hypothetical protein SAMN03159423_0338 [Bradyrhizobium sp. NFR13]|nr:hypothetical protein SAMN03159423_0338 [Bradyrhizobium sp. NFR13]
MSRCGISTARSLYCLMNERFGSQAVYLYHQTAEIDLNEKVQHKEELYRRLQQSRRFLREPIDAETKSRIAGLVTELEQQLAVAEARDASPIS